MIGLIGGTGVDEIPGFVSEKSTVISTRFGNADIVEAEFEGHELVFVPRHGLAHNVPPSQINYRAQIAALKKLGISCVVGVCAVGSLQRSLPPGSFAVLSDFIDLTKKRQDTFFDQPEGPVMHTDFTQPYCPAVSAVMVESCKKSSVQFEKCAVYIGVDGPRYESPAEISLYSSWGAHVIGMTNLPEVVLAREAGLCYGALAIITNYAAGISPTPLTHDEVRQAVGEASGNLLKLLQLTLRHLPHSSDCICASNNGLLL